MGSIGPISMTTCFSMLGHFRVLAALRVVVAWHLRLVSHLGALVARAALLLATVLAASFSAETVERPVVAAAREGRLLSGALVLLCLLRRVALLVLVATQGPAAVVVRLPVYLLVHPSWLALVPRLPGP